MAPYTSIPLSPAELSYLHTSLSQTSPIRPDGRSQTDFRSLTAESDILPNANGSARICFADGTEAIVGIKVEVENTLSQASAKQGAGSVEDEEEVRGRDDWLEVSINIPGVRDDDTLSAFLSALLSEAVLAGSTLKERLVINTRFHWRLYVDVSVSIA